ncbi:hypothetical protein GW916_12015 [bacterium]|nr:hypothetical protein [bacterium]
MRKSGRFRKKILNLFIFPFYFFPLMETLSSLAQAEVSKKESSGKPGSVEASLIDYNQYLSEKFDNMAEEVDLFLSNKSHTDQQNPSAIRLNYFDSIEEGGNRNPSFHFNVDLRLPNLEEKWSVSFTSYDQDKESRSVRSKQQRVQPRTENYGAGLALFQNLGRIKTSFRPRIELRDPLQTSYTLRFEGTSPVEPYRLYPRLELFGDSEKGTGQFVSLHMELSSHPDFSLAVFSEEEYQDARNLFTTTHGLSLGKPLTKKLVASPTITFYSTNRESYHLEDFTASVGLSHQPYREVFHYNITPYWRFSKLESFKGKVGISVETELIF